jgi:hypothetical protein
LIQCYGNSHHEIYIPEKPEIVKDIKEELRYLKASIAYTYAAQKAAQLTVQIPPAQEIATEILEARSWLGAQSLELLEKQRLHEQLRDKTSAIEVIKIILKAIPQKRTDQTPTRTNAATIYKVIRLILGQDNPAAIEIKDSFHRSKSFLEISNLLERPLRGLFLLFKFPHLPSSLSFIMKIDHSLTK